MADPILDNLWTRNIVKQDLLLLENQIPFFVLEHLFQLTLAKISGDQTTENPKPSLTDYVLSYFGNMMSPEGHFTDRASTTTTTCGPPRDSVLQNFGNKMKRSEEDEDQIIERLPYCYILHLVHEAYGPKNDQKEKKERSKFMPSASELDYAGVKFVPGRGEDLFNVKFTDPLSWCHSARFEIPTIGIYDSTESFFRNLIAFEQTYPGVSRHFTSYAYLMDMLVNSEKDIQVLEKAGVMFNYLGASEDATHLFNNLCKGSVVLGEFFFANECNKATDYSKQFWPKHMADLKRTYFASPWKFIAFILAFIVFGIQIVTFVQSGVINKDNNEY